jgi:hypothetical protein
MTTPDAYAFPLEHIAKHPSAGEGIVQVQPIHTPHLIKFGWISNRFANSATVCSPRSAANATFALKAGEWFRRERRATKCSLLKAYSPSAERSHHLCGCPISRGHLSFQYDAYGDVKSYGTGSGTWQLQLEAG